MARLRGAVVGFGNVAERGHWPGLAKSPDLEIVAVVDPSPWRRDAAADLAPGLPTYASIEELAASESLDFVDIATPPSSHAALAAFALARGWHVLCEKPLTLDPRVLAHLAASATAHDCALFTMHNWKVAPIFQAAFEAIHRGRVVGGVQHVDVLVFRNQPCQGASDGSTGSAAAAAENWRQDRGVAGGGILVDHGWHNFYLLLNLVGSDPSQLAATITHLLDDPLGLDDSARVVVAFAHADAYLHLTWRAATRRNAVIVYGDDGVLAIDDDRLVVARRGAAPEQVVFPSALSAGSHHQEWFRDLLPHFVSEVREPALRGRNLREAAWCVALIDAAYRSAAAGGRETPIARPEARLLEVRTTPSRQADVTAR